MSTRFWKFVKGIILKPETTDATENIEGSVWVNGTDNEIRSYLDSAVRTVVTEDQVQTLTNKTIDAPTNTINDISNSNIAVDAEIEETKLDLDFPTANLDGAITAHIDSLSDAHEASAISYDKGLTTLSAENVQAAIDEVEGRIVGVEGDISGHIGEGEGAHAASAISVSLISGLDADEVQAALEELQGDIDGFIGFETSSVKSTFFGQVIGMTTDVLIEADNAGIAGNSILLTGPGTVQDKIDDWNTGNPGNTASLISGDGSQFTFGDIQLSGGNSAAGNIGEVLYNLGSGEYGWSPNVKNEVSQFLIEKPLTIESTEQIVASFKITTDNESITRVYNFGESNYLETRVGGSSSSLSTNSQTLVLSTQYSPSQTSIALAPNNSRAFRFQTNLANESYIQVYNGTTGNAPTDGIIFGLDTSNNALLLMQENASLIFGANNAEGLRINVSQETELQKSLLLNEIITPVNPAANKHKIYPKNDGKLYHLNSAGQEVKLGGSGYDLQGSFTVANNQSSPANVTDFVLNPAEGEFAKVDYSIVRKHTSPDTYLRESGLFYIQYNDDTSTWTITGETFAGTDAEVDLSVSGNQVQYESSNITGTLSKSVLNFYLKYL